MTLLVLSEADIRELVSPAVAIESQRQAYRAVSDHQIRAAGGVAFADPVDDSLVFALTGAVAGVTGIVCKFGFQSPRNAHRGLPAVHAFVMLLDPFTGVQLACLNGTTVTTMRTAAGVAAAADALARPDATQLAVIGSGVQAREVVRMMAAIRPLSGVRIWSRTAVRADALASDLRTELELEVSVASSAEKAVRDADLVATCTSSREPVVRGEWLATGVTVVTLGSYEADRREVDLAVSGRAAAVYVDQLEKAAAQCGPVLEAASSQASAEPPLEIGAVLAGSGSARTAPDDILVFHSVGVGVQDATLAWMAYQRAEQHQVGHRIAF